MTFGVVVGGGGGVIVAAVAVVLGVFLGEGRRGERGGG